MTTFGALNCIPGLKAAADLSSYQFRFMKYSSAGKVTFQNATGGFCVGVLQDKPAAANRAAAVAGYNGTMTKVVAGAAVSAGADVMSDTVGRAITHTSGGYNKLGVAFSAASAAGELIDVCLVCTGLDVNVATGTIQIDLTRALEIATNDVQNLAAVGGLMASDSTPSLARVNGATDKALRLAWAASNSNEIAFPPIAKPADLDASSDLTIHLFAGMAGATDTPTIDVQCFDGVGDTEMGGATAALSDTAGEVSVTIANANLAAAPGFLNVALVPGAHTTDILYLYAAWVEYTRAAN